MAEKKEKAVAAEAAEEVVEAVAETTEKKPAAKKTAAKKTADKPVAEKKETVKKTASKKTAEKETEEKPKAEKKPATKKAPAKKAVTEETVVESVKVETEEVLEKIANPKTSAKKAKKAEGITIQLIKGFGGKKKDQIATAKSLGLKRIGDVTVQPDNAATLGKIAKISHMLKVTKA